MGSAACSSFAAFRPHPPPFLFCVPRGPLLSLSVSVDYEQIAGRLSTLELGSLVWQPSELEMRAYCDTRGGDNKEI